MADPASIAISIAVSVALSLVTALLTPKQRVEGPRLRDKRVTTSAFGEAIPVCFGTNRLNGNIIWGTDIEEEKRTENIGKGSLFGAGTQTTYTYFGNFAVAFGEGEAFGIVKLYADGQLIYDAEDETGEGGRIDGLKFRFYPGSQTQEPDPLIQEDVDAREGANSTPAYRGTVYVVFERLALQEFGNRIPQIEAVIAWKGDNANRVGVKADTSTVTQLFAPQRVAVDSQRGVVYALTRDPISTTMVLTAHSLRTGELIASRPWLEILAEIDPENDSGWNNPATSAHWVGNLSGNEGDYLIARPVFGNTAPIGFIEKATLSGVGFIGTVGVSYQTTETAFTGFADQVAVVPVQDSFGRLRHYVLGGGSTISNTSNFWIVERQITGGILYTFGADWEPGASDYFVGIQAGPSRLGFRDVFLASREISSGTAGKLTIRRLKLLNVPAVGGATETSDGDFNITPEVIYEQTTGTDGDGLVSMAWDESAGGLIVANPGVGTGLLNVDTGQWVWFLDGVDSLTPFGDQVGAIASDGFAWPVQNGSAFSFVDPATGEYLSADDFNWTDTFTGGTFTPTAGTVPVWDGSLERAYLVGTSGVSSAFATLYGPRITGIGDTLQNVVTQIATRGALSASDLDVTDLSGTVSGYKIERQSTIRDALTPLGTAYNFDAAEVSGVIEFKHRDGVSDLAIAEADLVPNGDGIAVEEVRGQEIEAPLAVSVEYVAPSRDYQVGTQIIRRIKSPVPVVSSNGESTVQIPIALTEDQAAAVAERLLFQAWIERERYAFTVSAEFLELVPNDIITLTADGLTRTIRAERVSVGGGDRAIEIEAVASEPFVYDVAAVSVSAGLPVPQIVPGAFPTLVAHALDIPLLRDEDSQGFTALIYVAASREIASLGTFDGANISTAVAGAEFRSRLFLPNEATYFAATTALADAPDDEFFSIHETTFTARLIRGTAPATVTEAQLIGEDANTLAVFNATTQGWEIIGARDVTDNGDGTYTFGGIFRSKRGSETHAFGHKVGDRVVVLTSTTVDGYTQAASALSAAASVVANSPGQLLEDGAFTPLTYRLESLKPYAPVQVAAAWDGSDIDLSWVRRTRLNGGWIDGTGTVPVSEEAESYEIDIYSGPTTGSPAGTVLRTLTSTTTAATYTAAQIASDFGSPAPSELTVKVYQVSAAVGRGFALEKTIEVT